MKFIERFVFVMEWVAALLLALLTVLGLGSFFVAAAESKANLLSSDTVSRLLDEIMLLFIVIELFKMTFAYMRNTNVLPVAFEAVLIALARKIVVAEFPIDGGLAKASALAVLTVAVGVTWFLVGRVNSS
jgi:uncharacterized membrane protein (DUF373 family)